MCKLDTDRHKQTARVFWKYFKWIGLGFLIFILCDILGDGFRPILNESRTAQVVVDDRWTQWIDSLYTPLKSVSNWIVLATGPVIIVALLIIGLVSMVRRVFFK